MKQPKPQVGALCLTAVVLAYTVVYSTLSIVRYNTFHAYTFDLGIQNQAVWNTAHGRWFETSIGRMTNAELIGSYLGNHVQPILLLLAPFYRLWPDPRLMLIIQSVGLGSAAFPLFWIARQRLSGQVVPLMLSLCYLAYPALGFLNLYDFHPIAFSIPLLLVAYWALMQKRTGLFWVCVLLALATKEELVVPIGAWGLTCLLRREHRRTGLALVALAVVWAALCLGLIIPHYNEGQAYRFLSLWSHLPGLSSFGSVQGGTALPAGGPSLQLAVPFLLHLAVPLGLLFLLSPIPSAIALPSLAYILSGARPELHAAGYQYPAVLIPWLFLGTIEGLRRVRAIRIGRLSRHTPYIAAVACMLAGTLVRNLLLNPIAVYAGWGSLRHEPHHDQLLEAMAHIPSAAGVATINGLGAPLANRRVLIALEYPPPLRLDHLQMADYVLLDLVDCRAVVAPDPRAEYANIVRQVLQTGSFRVRYWSDRVLLLERGQAPQEELVAVIEYVTALVEHNRPCW